MEPAVTRLVLDHPFPTPPEPGCVQEVASGVLWIRMALPFALDHINLWAIEDTDGWTLVDAGIGDDSTLEQWEALFAGPLAGKKVSRLICTHFHPDHMGMAGPLCERWGILLTATVAEWTYGRMLMLDQGPDYHANQVEHYRRAGYGEALLDGIRKRSGGYPLRIRPLPPAIATIRDGDVLRIGGRAWRVLVGNGHSPEHACLVCDELNVIISGDQILPKISPVVGVWPQEPDSDPLTDFLRSLEKLRLLPPDILVLPSHKLPFRGLHARIDDLIAHHDERLDRTREGCARPATALEVLKVLFPRELDEYQTGFAMGETLAHLNHLVTRGEVRRRAREDGVWIFERT